MRASKKEFEQKLKEFLVEAKTKAYASGVKYNTTAANLCEFECTNGDLKFKDTYFGHYDFGGIEIVWHKNEPIWAMNYFGATNKKFLKNEELIEECYALLRKALEQVAQEKPFRGPKKLSQGEWVYENKTTGKIGRFSGKEKILYKGKEIYSLKYFGGNSRGKE